MARRFVYSQPATFRPALSPRDLARAAALALAFGVFYALSFQQRYFGDGPGLASLHVLGGEERYYHVLYLPACDFVQRVLGLHDPFLAPRLLSSAPAALGLGGAYLVLRLFGTEVFGALVAVLLLAFSPALWFFGTTIEVHALLFGTVALVATLTLLAPWQRPRLALALVALMFPLLYWAHQAAFVLGPGWVWLVQYARARHGQRYSWRALVFGVGPVLLAALLGGVLVSFLVRFGSLDPLWAEVQEQLAIQASQQGTGIVTVEPVWRDEWLLPLGVLVPLALLGAARLRSLPWRAPAIGMLVLFPLAFFLWWCVTENGGYFLGSDAFLLVPVALLFGRASTKKGLLALALVALQGIYAHTRIAAFDHGWDADARVERVRAALGEHGLLLSTVNFAPDVRCALPGVEEVSLTAFVRHACQRERTLLSPEQVLAEAKPLLQRLLLRNEHLALEIGYHTITAAESSAIVAFAPALEALERFLREHYDVRELPDPYWPLLVLSRRP